MRFQMRYHICMTHAMTVRLDDETFQRLKELEVDAASRSAAVVTAIREAWDRLQEEKLQAAYEAAVADSPTYPYENDDERTALRARRNARQRATA
ncbi:MAG: antitoxin [Nocardia sp.]|nr:antitoxin [Nocardia sp.]